ncbi:unnamed protein product [Ostreobium quekettii]|uniref:Serine-threonine/tyrosine-protein kinase catalytic domain-containing protein n=1 Tax=Ostreobium quekettii TaxID=121088 RepID=A0A8S1JET1_9CHLO|nr:unnamed protein product [Ostreobium quekettii]
MLLCRYRGTVSADPEAGTTPTQHNQQNGALNDEDYIAFVPSDVNRTLSTIPSVTEDSCSSSDLMGPVAGHSIQHKAPELRLGVPTRMIRKINTLKEATAQLMSPFEVESNVPQDLFPIVATPPDVRWAPAIPDIENVIAMEGGWAVAGEHGSVQEGVWVDEEGRAHKVAVKRRREWSNEGCLQALRREFQMISKVPYHPNVAWLVGVHFGKEPFVVEELMAKNLQQARRNSPFYSLCLL